MADLDHINPMHPIWPTRPANKREKQHPQPRHDEQPAEEKPGHDDADDDGPHIDEYA